MTETPTLSERNHEIHLRQNALFLAHQRALLDRDVPRARRTLADYIAAFTAHAEVEEREVLPRYAAHGGDETHSPTAQFRLEHDKIRRRLAALSEQLGALPDAAGDVEILAMLDAESWLKGLLAHHDDRETGVLYPRLDARLLAGERRFVREALDAAETAAGGDTGPAAPRA